MRLKTSNKWMVTCLALALASCGGKSDDPGDTGEEAGSGLNTQSGSNSGASDDGGSSESEADTNADGVYLDVMMDSGNMTADGDGGDGDCDGVEPPTPTAQLTGTVYAPNLEIPISGALVYLTNDDPDPVPDGVYCAECVSLPCDSHYAFTAADGSFILPAITGNQKLVVQKGQFLHVTDFDVQAGNNVVPAQASNLPDEWNPAEGKWIPRIMVAYTSNDQIENILAKIGLGDIDDSGVLVPGSEKFDHLQSADAAAVLDDPERLDDYHIVFIPCMAQGGLGAPDTGARLDNIRNYVEAGGKWYVTDWANEYLYEPFPNYQTMHNQASNPDLGSYDSEGTVLDPDLLAWLEALPAPLKDIGNGAPTLYNLPNVTLEHNWSGVDATPDVIVQNDEGEDVNVGHHVWAEGPCTACTDGAVKPMSMTASYSCGRMMFSTYHTNAPYDGHTKLTPQELVLLYIILEIGVCFDEPPPPPPPID
jgi:hypothetical protein